MNSGKVIMIVIAGMVTGTIAGVLFAPANGGKTRKRLLLKGKDHSVRLKEKTIRLLESMAVVLEKLVDEVFVEDNEIVYSEQEVLQDAQII